MGIGAAIAVIIGVSNLSLILNNIAFLNVCLIVTNPDSDKSSADRYEDEDTQYDGEREGSDSDSPSPR